MTAMNRALLGVLFILSIMTAPVAAKAAKDCCTGGSCCNGQSCCRK